MARYMIHACPKRMWYVNDYMIPSMLEKGISEKDIHVFNDDKKLGNLKAFLASFKWILENWNDVEGVWHLQDDVILCHDFRHRTEVYDKGMVYGFQSEYDNATDLWYSFPCIRIKNSIIPKFLYWLNNEIELQHNKEIITLVSNNKYDDELLKRWLYNYYKDYIVRVSPNLVDHVDWIIGGSTVNKQRNNKIVRSVDWKDEYLVDELKERLTNGKCR